MFDQAINVNTAWAASITVEDFIAHESHHGISEERLREIHKVCVQREKPSKPAKVKAAPAED